MTHKVVILKPEFNYTGTEVPFDRSLEQVMGMLRKFKCERIIELTEPVKDDPELELKTIGFQKAGLSYIIEFPVTYVQKRDGKKLNMKISGRIIHDRIKAMLIDVEIGYLDFSQAMMPYIAIPDETGRPVSLQDHVEGQKKHLQQGMFDLCILPAGNSR